MVSKVVLSEEYSSFERLRARVIDRATYVLPVLLLPVAIANFFQGYYALAVSAFAGATMVSANLFAARLGRPRPIHNIFIVFALTMITILSLTQRGVNGAFWVAPTIVVFSIVFPQRSIRGYIFIYAAAVISTAFFSIDIENAWRLAISTAVTLALVNILLDVIYTLQGRVMDLAVRDELTGAFNRREMSERLRVAVDRKRRHGVCSTLLALDIDHFKTINDVHGHAGGDRVLTGFVQLIRETFRRADEVYRAGGEEFFVLLPDTAASGGRVLAEKILEKLRDSEFAGIKVTTSIGIAELRSDEAVNEWIARADRALYQAKRSGRDQAVEG